MAEKIEYEKVGEVYRRKNPPKKSFGDQVGEVFGFLVICFIVGAVLAQCAG